MLRLTQTRVGSPNGTCLATCLASILDEPNVPDFGMNVSDEEFFENMAEWLAERGLRYRERPITGKAPRGYHLILGISPRGGQHAVVGRNGKMVHDPHPQDGTGRGLALRRAFGILEPLEVGMAHDSEVPQEYRELMLPVEYRTGTCPGCGKDAQLNLDGTVEKHGNCPGWGLPAMLEKPAHATDDHIGFKKLKNKLAHRKGVTNPGALAAYIGRKKYGAKGMAKKAAAGRKHAADMRAPRGGA